MVYRRKLQKDDYGYIVWEIGDRFDAVWTRWSKNMVVLNKLDTVLDYHKSGSKIHTPSETLTEGSGDCQDKAVLFGNLFLASGFDIRILSLTHMDDDNRGHISLQVRVPVNDPSEATSQIRETHEEIFGQRPGKMAWSNYDDDLYFMADPGWSDYPGDRGSLTGSYIKESGDSWEFYQIDNEWFVETLDGFCDSDAAETNINWRKNRS
jgi:hypothetical protein